MIEVLVVLAVLKLISPGLGFGKEGEHVKFRLGGPVETVQVDRPSFEQIDHAPFDALLKEFVDCHGLVAYGRWKCDCNAVARLNDYLVSLGHVNLAAPGASCEARIAYYLNAYNGLAIWGILQEYPTPSVRSCKLGKNGRFFDDLELWIGDRFASLNVIEHQYLRPLGDPRVQFAITRASIGGPRLRNEAYQAVRIHEQLSDDACAFFRDGDHFAAYPYFRTVKLSPILRWRHCDFGANDTDLLAAILPYVPDCDRPWLADHLCAKVKFFGFDWSLNDQCESLKSKLKSAPTKLKAHVSILAKKDPLPAPPIDCPAEDGLLFEAVPTP